MADIVNSLFGVNVAELQNRQYQNDQQMSLNISNVYRRPGNRIGALIGANIGQGLARGLFNIQDPLIDKAKQFEQILQQTQAQSGDNPVQMYKDLAKNLADAGFARESQQVLQQGIALEQSTQLNSLKMLEAQSGITKNVAQAAKSTQEKAPEIVRLIQARDAYLESGDQTSAAAVQNQIDKLGYVAEKVQTPENMAQKAVLDKYVREFGQEEGGKKFLEYLNDLAKQKSAVQGTGSTLTNSNGEVIGSTNKKGDVTLKNGQVVPQKEYSGYSTEQEAGLQLLSQLDMLDSGIIDTAFSKLIDTTAGDAVSRAAALANPEINSAQVKVQALRVQDTLKNLLALKGPTSDKDMAVVMSTFPGFNSSAQTMKDWIVRAKAASVNFLTKRAEKYGFEPPDFNFAEFVNDPVFQGASKKEKMRAITTFRKLPFVWGKADEPTQIKALAASENGAAEIKTGNKTEFTFNGQTFTRPPHATDEQWNKYKLYITSGAK